LHLKRLLELELRARILLVVVPVYGVIYAPETVLRAGAQLDDLMGYVGRAMTGERNKDDDNR